MFGVDTNTTGGIHPTKGVEDTERSGRRIEEVEKFGKDKYV